MALDHRYLDLTYQSRNIRANLRLVDLLSSEKKCRITADLGNERTIRPTSVEVV